MRSGRARLPHSRTRTHDRSVSVELTREDDDEVDEEALAALAESFHSESGRHRHSKRVSWNQDFSGFARVPAPLSPLMSSNAPPSLRITTNNSEVSVATRSTILRSVSSDNLEGPSYTSESPTATRASKKSAGLVLLGVGFLFAMGSMPAGNHSALSSQSNLGRVLDLGPAPIINAAIHSSPSMHPLRTEPVVLRFDGNVLKSRAGQDDPVSTERLLGRFFAWLCTTLYLTSRLPQIWKNVSLRRIVPDLSHTPYPIVRKKVCRGIPKRCALRLDFSDANIGLIDVSLRLCFSRKCLLCHINPHVRQHVFTSTGSCSILERKHTVGRRKFP